jgi:hypothetical protein
MEKIGKVKQNFAESSGANPIKEILKYIYLISLKFFDVVLIEF